MKCPNCGAETQSKICEFCGSEMPKEKININIVNNYYDNTNNLTVGKCPNCGGNKVNFKRERIGKDTRIKSQKNVLTKGRKGREISQTTYRTVGVCQNCGYTWNPNTGTSEKNGSKTWIWILGWICIFPIPLTILMLRKKEMKQAAKYGIIAVAWIIYFLIVIFGGDENITPQVENQLEQTFESTQVVSEITDDVAEEIDASTYIDNIVEAYNSWAQEQLVFIEEFTPQDKTNGHYRTEFRLDTDGAIGKCYLLGDSSIDIVADPTVFGDFRFRIYTISSNLEQAKNLIQGMSPLLDVEMTIQELNDTLKYVETEKYSNGYYFGNLGITLSGTDDKGYSLMLKKD